MRSMSMIVMASVIGAIVLICISLVVRNRLADSAAAAMETGPVVVAKTDIKLGDVLSDQNVSFQEWPLSNIPEGAATKPTDIEGQCPIQPIYLGESILSRKLCPIDELYGPSCFPEQFRVVSVHIRDDAESRLVPPGDQVDVFANHPKSRDEQVTSPRTVVSNVKVFAIDQFAQPDERLGRLSLLFERTQTEQMGLLKSAAEVDGPLFVRRSVVSQQNSNGNEDNLE